MERYNSNMFLIIIVCASAILSSTFAAETAECGLINADQYNNKHKVAQIDEFPWMAKIAYKNTKTSKTSFACHAVLISQQHLLTTAHCLNNMSLKPYAVLFGDWNSSNNFTEADCDEVSGKCFTPILIDIEKFVQHPMADDVGKNNDIGLLLLTQKVTYSDYIRPICLPGNDIIANEFETKQLTLSGWLMKNPGVKRKLSVSIYNQEDCQNQYEKMWHTKIADSHICAISCEDGVSYLSAAALMDIVDQKSKPNNVYLAGLLSFGAKNCAEETPDVFTRVDRYLGWIKENMN